MQAHQTVNDAAATSSQPSLTQYSSHYLSTFSSHYAQAYMSSNSASSNPLANQLISHNHNGLTTPANNHRSSSNGLYASAHWYRPGSSRCTVKGCNFTASHKTVEIHMMDRHLIYPPGYEKRPKKLDWDADPSLKGKPIPIQGTTVILDSPEVLEAWIAERKKRWPTILRVEEKKRKMEDAVSRGQLLAEDTSLRGVKRRRADGSHDRHRMNDTFGNFSRARGGGRGADSGYRGRGRGRARGVINMPFNGIPQRPQHQPSPGSHSSPESESDGEPEVVSSKNPLLNGQDTHLALDPDDDKEGLQENTEHSATHPTRHVAKSYTYHPQKEPYNPFMTRPTLLLNLLLPEIRMTISNLSQAIRFLVDNDFLNGVEVKPGEADESMIKILNRKQEH